MKKWHKFLFFIIILLFFINSDVVRALDDFSFILYNVDNFQNYKKQSIDQKNGIYNFLLKSNNAFYIGSQLKFTQFDWNLTSNFDGLKFRLEYWDGSLWKEFRLLNDNTKSLKYTGIISFNDDGDWTKKNLDGKRIYWIRIVPLESAINKINICTSSLCSASIVKSDDIPFLDELPILAQPTIVDINKVTQNTENSIFKVQDNNVFLDKNLKIFNKKVLTDGDFSGFIKINNTCLGGQVLKYDSLKNIWTCGIDLNTLPVLYSADTGINISDDHKVSTKQDISQTATPTFAGLKISDKTINSGSITNWNTSYGWGSHATAGYLKVETDPVFISSAASSIENSDITNWNNSYSKMHDHNNKAILDSISSLNISSWNTSYGWGNHATAGYLKTEVDPVFSSSPAHSITNSNIADWNLARANTHLHLNLSTLDLISDSDLANWNTSYGWGNHASAGYLTATSSNILRNKTWNSNTIEISYGGTGTNIPFTFGSIVFAGINGVYSENNSNLFWDDTNNSLGIGLNSNINGNLGIMTSTNDGTTNAINIVNSDSDLILSADSYGSLVGGGDIGNSRFKITREGGYAIRLLNSQGSTVNKGVVVMAATNTDDSFMTASANSISPIGVLYENCANNTYCWIVVSGIADVLFQNNQSATSGYWVYVSGTAGRAINSATPNAILTTYQRSVGHAIESVAGAAGGVLVRVVLQFN